MFNFRSNSEYILGVSASSRRIEAVLVHNTVSGPVVLRSFTRNRSNFDPKGNTPVFNETVAIDDMGPDISFDVGNSASDLQGLFLSSEFGPVDAPAPAKEKSTQEFVSPNLFAQPCDKELLEIISECTSAGYPNVSVVFALPTENLGITTIAPPKAGQLETDGKKKKKEGQGKKTENLIEQLRGSHPGKVVDEKTVFLPLISSGTADASHVAVFALATEPVSLSLQSIRDRKQSFPNALVTDTEPTLMLGMVRAALLSRSKEHELISEEKTPAKTEKETTVLVRVGSEDTLVMFLLGDELMHLENLRSITAFDPAETICSRILLMHDEFGVGDAHSLYLYSDVGENSLFKTLNQFFPQTQVNFLREVLPHFHEDRDAPIEKETVLATAVALRFAKDELFEGVFPEIDFLDQKLKSKRIQLPFSWPVAAMALLLFASTLFFVYRYFDLSHDLEMTRLELSSFPEATISENADLLQSRLDSLRMRSENYVGALDLLDSLLIGSDRWSRALERTSVNTEDIYGLWIESWEETSAGTLTMSGTATDRNQIVAFASKSGANIENMEFASIREVSVFTFTMTMPIKTELPEAAVYLREHASELPNAFSEALEPSESPPASVDSE